MSKEPYVWLPDAPPPVLQPHSRAKHDVRAYLEQYVGVLTANPAQERLRLTLVDGFAGGGQYLDAQTKQLRFGSPLLMLEAMEVAEARAKALRRKTFHLDVNYIFIEENRQTAAYLRKTIEDSRFATLSTSESTS